MTTFNDLSTRAIAIVSSLAFSAILFAAAITPAVQNASGTGMIA